MIPTVMPLVPSRNSNVKSDQDLEEEDPSSEAVFILLVDTERKIAQDLEMVEKSFLTERTLLLEVEIIARILVPRVLQPKNVGFFMFSQSIDKNETIIQH